MSEQPPERTPEEAKQYAARATVRYAEVVREAWDKMGARPENIGKYDISASWIDDVLIVAARGETADQIAGYLARERLATPTTKKPAE